MFIIRVKDKNHIWGNSLHDDFLQFLPEKLEVPKEQIEAYFIPKSNEQSVRAIQDIDSVNPAQFGVKLKRWPYDEQGRFLGNKID
jgi:hypothetical protein